MRVKFYLFLILCAIFIYYGETGLIPSVGSDYFSSPLNLFRLPITFYKGTIGVNFLGFHASAGLLGGLLAENGSPGGPHAEASTPFGQSAAAGLGYRFDNGSTIGYLYADAQLGKNVVGVCILLSRIYTSSVTFLTWNQCANTFNITN